MFLRYMRTLMSVEISNAGAFTTHRQAGGVKRARQGLGACEML